MVNVPSLSMKRSLVYVENSRLSRTFLTACKTARLTKSVPESKGNICLFVTGLEKNYKRDNGRYS